ncbi:MAG: hypothetical protein V1859_01615 [archaeon]
MRQASLEKIVDKGSYALSCAVIAARYAVETNLLDETPFLRSVTRDEIAHGIFSFGAMQLGYSVIYNYINKIYNRITNSQLPQSFRYYFALLTATAVGVGVEVTQTYFMGAQNADFGQDIVRNVIYGVLPFLAYKRISYLWNRTIEKKQPSQFNVNS